MRLTIFVRLLFCLFVMLAHGCASRKTDPRTNETNREKLIRVMGPPMTDAKMMDGRSSLFYAVPRKDAEEPCILVFDFDKFGKFIDGQKSGCQER